MSKLELVVNDVLAEWHAMYASAGIVCDVSSLVVPERRTGFDRLLIIPRGLTSNRVVAELRKHFNVWSYYDDPDAAIVKNDREPTETYAVWLRDRVEADEELKKLSVDDLAERNIRGATLLERLCYEWKYFAETCEHLDRDNNITLCSGSRGEDGDVPYMRWDSIRRELRIYMDGQRYSSSRMRAFAVVS